MAKPYEIRIRITGEGAPQVQMIKRDLEAVKRSAAGVDKNLARGNKQTKALGRNMKTAGGHARSMGTHLKRAMGFLGLAAGGYMVVGTLKDASRMAMELEKNLANVNSLLGKSHPMYNQYREDILKLKRVVPVLEIKDLTAGLYEGVSAGHDAAHVMEYLNATAKAAAGGWTDVATVIKGTNKVMAAYGIETKNAMYATDIGLKTVEKANLSYAEYADKIGMCVGSAATARVSIEELHAAIAAASKIQKPEQVFTGLRGAMLDLPKKRAELRALGIEYTTLADTLRQIKKAEFTPEDWQALGMEREGAETLKAIILQYETFTDAMAELGDVGGATMDKFNERMATTEAKTAAAKSIMDEYKTAIGVELNEALVQAITGMDEFNKSADEPLDTSSIKEFGEQLSLLVEIFGTVKKAYDETIGRWPKALVGMFDWDPLGLRDKGRKFGAFGETGTAAGVEAARAELGTWTPAPAMPARKPAPGGGDTITKEGTKVHIDKVEVNANKVDEKSFLNMVGKIVEEEVPA